MTVRALSDILDTLHTASQSGEISVDKIVDIFHERGFGALLFILALPAALPIPAVGYGTVLALPLLLLTAQQMIGRRTVWLPQRLKSKKLNASSIEKTASGAQKWVQKIEFIIRPRLGFITQGIFSNFIGLCGFIMAFSVLIPLPLTNTVPSLGIALMAAGVLMRDGLAVIVGMFIGLAWVGALTYFSVMFGAEGLDMMKEFIKSVM